MRSRSSFGIGSGSSETPSSSRSECLASVPSWSISTCADWPEIAPCTTTLPRCSDALTVHRLVRHSSWPVTLTMSGTARTTVPIVAVFISSPATTGTAVSALSTALPTVVAMASPIGPPMVAPIVSPSPPTTRPNSPRRGAAGAGAT